MEVIEQIVEQTEAEYLVDLPWSAADLLGFIYGEDCEYDIVRKDLLGGGYKIVQVTCSDNSIIEFLMDRSFNIQWISVL